MSEVFFEEKLIDDRDNYTFYTFHNEKFVFPKTKIKTVSKHLIIDQIVKIKIIKIYRYFSIITTNYDQSCNCTGLR
jgi:hypothetical protein